MITIPVWQWLVILGINDTLFMFIGIYLSGKRQ